MGLKRHLLAAAVVLSVAITASADIPNWVGNQTTLNVCTSPYTPMVTCTNDTDASNYSGYEVELARKVFALVGWQPSMLTWLCLDWEEMMAHLRAGDGVCNLAAAGVMVSTAEIANGIVFSWPTYQNGLGVAIINNQRAASIWAFANAFSWDVWIVTVLTCLSVGLIVFIMDCVMARRAGTPQLQRPSLAQIREQKTVDEYIWEAMGRAMQTRDHVSTSLPGNFVILLFAFMMLVLVTLFTANTTANITATRLQTTIRGIQDLPGKAVGTWTDYTSTLLKYGVAAAGFPWDNTDDERAMFNALESGTIQALVLDMSLLVYRAANNCDIAVVGQAFENFDQAIAFENGTNTAALLPAINDALVQLQENGDIADLEGRYINPPSATCKTSGVSDESTQISMAQVAGLWILLASGIGIACVLMVVMKLHERYTSHKVRALTTKFRRSMSRAMSGSGKSESDNVEAGKDAGGGQSTMPGEMGI